MFYVLNVNMVFFLNQRCRYFETNELVGMNQILRLKLDIIIIAILKKFLVNLSKIFFNITKKKVTTHFKDLKCIINSQNELIAKIERYRNHL